MKHGLVFYEAKSLNGKPNSSQTPCRCKEMIKSYLMVTITPGEIRRKLVGFHRKSSAKIRGFVSEILVTTPVFVTLDVNVRSYHYYYVCFKRLAFCLSLNAPSPKGLQSFIPRADCWQHVFYFITRIIFQTLPLVCIWKCCF